MMLMAETDILDATSLSPSVSRLWPSSREGNLGLAMRTCSPTADAKQSLWQCEHHTNRGCQLLKSRKPFQSGRLRRCRAVTVVTAQQVATPQRSAAMHALARHKGGHSHTQDGNNEQRCLSTTPCAG